MRSFCHNKVVDMAIQLRMAIKESDYHKLPPYFTPEGWMEDWDKTEVARIDHVLRKINWYSFCKSLATRPKPWCAQNHAKSHAAAQAASRTLSWNTRRANSAAKSAAASSRAPRFSRYVAANKVCPNLSTTPRGRRRQRDTATARGQSEPLPGDHTQTPRGTATTEGEIKQQPPSVADGASPANERQGTRTPSDPNESRRALEMRRAGRSDSPGGTSTPPSPRATVAAEDL